MEIDFILFENLFKPRQLHLAVLKYSLRLAS
ncbi:DNA alkylation repair protein [Streptococcus shenyangsis]|uniref:DNA alkylation repair protein n=2 Tax=Streptococcus TaxID=1301 RepID=A0A2I1Z2T8_STRMT|nr:DNA alkylation repair protein [Streptococcus mitis]TPE37369.1 DNA alkylation repair protein [Streptococcus sp. D2]TPE37423.1 DNA alkylation repair protein [Streptococcus shenyangsis]